MMVRWRATFFESVRKFRNNYRLRRISLKTLIRLLKFYSLKKHKFWQKWKIDLHKYKLRWAAEEYQRKMKKFRYLLRKKKISLKTYRSNVAFWTKMYNKDIENKNRWMKAKLIRGDQIHIMHLKYELQIINFQQFLVLIRKSNAFFNREKRKFRNIRFSILQK